MKSVVGIFVSPGDAQRAVEQLQAMGARPEQISLLVPGASERELAAVPTMGTEGPGVGKAFGGLVGGAVAAAGGIHLGTTVASLFLPGVGPVLAVGVAAAALLGAGGAAGGAALGEFLENSTEVGLPKDELFVYEDALRKGRSIVFLLAENEEQAEAGRQKLSETGAESVDAARENWWLGLRDVEHERYTAEGGDFPTDETYFRLGFEAAQRPELRGKSYAVALPSLQNRYATDIYSHPAFRRGYERGQVYFDTVRENRC